jgi:putative tributyrin esterase
MPFEGYTRLLMRRAELFFVTLLLCFGMAWIGGCSNENEPDHPRLVPGVVLQDARFQSAALGREMPYRVFLPAGINPGEKLPVVYLLHGRGPDFRDWSNHSDAASYALRGLILVMPEGGSSFYMNAVRTPRDRYEDYIVHDLVADVETRFPAKSGRADRAILGISMGGFGAITLALRHPETYAFAGGLSPALDVPERRFSPARPGQWWLFRGIFGPMGSIERGTRDPFQLIQTADPKAIPYLYLTVGEQEPLLEPNQRFASRLAQRHFPYEFRTSPGGHDWNEWNGQIPGCFERLLAVLNPSVQARP